jgi:hypothetical protein
MPYIHFPCHKTNAFNQPQVIVHLIINSLLGARLEFNAHIVGNMSREIYRLNHTRYFLSIILVTNNKRISRLLIPRPTQD